jgi:hypothetical protein
MHTFARKTFGFVGTLVLTTSLAGCNPDLSEINQKFPKVSIEKEEGRAVDSALRALDHATGSNVTASLTSAAIANAIKSAAQKQGVPVNVESVDAQKQFVWITVSIDNALSELGIADAKAAEEKYLGGVDPHITGQITLGMSVDSAYREIQDANTLTVHLLPALKSVKVDRVTLSGGFLDRIGLGAKVDISPATDLIVDALNGFSERIAGFAGELDLMAVHIPTVPFATGQIEQALAVAERVTELI